MNYNQFLFATPFFWVSIAAFFFGLSIAIVSGNVKERKRWTWFLFFLAFSFMLIITAIFVPGPKNFLDIRLLYCGGGVALITCLGFRFFKIVGIPVIFILMFLFVILSEYLSSWVPVREETRILDVKPLAITEKKINIELSAFSEDTDYYSIAPSGITIRIEKLRFDEYFFFIGSFYWVRIRDVVVNKKDDENDPSLSQISGPVPSIPVNMKGFFSFIHASLQKAPGVSVITVKRLVTEFNVLQNYRFKMNEEGKMLFTVI